MAGVTGRYSARRAERGIALVAAAMRAVVLLQIVLSVTSGTRLADPSAAYAALAIAVIAVSVVLIVQCLVTGSVRPGWWHVPDVILAWTAIPSMTLLLPEAVVIGRWEAWASGFAINVSMLASTWMRPRRAVVHGVVLGVWYLLWSADIGTSSWETMLNNGLTIPGYAIVVALLVHYLRALARDADDSREDAIAATRALELQRYQLAVHDASSILRLLSDEQTPAEVLPGLRLQANREALRLRNYLGAPGGPSVDPQARTVGTMLMSALEGFDDLPLEPAIELGAHVELGDDVWEATRQAVTTVLHNVRIHAAARQVVVHADADGDAWEVVISDDGVGFDQRSQPLGFGLSTQVVQALADVGVRATIESSPGRGTSVTLVSGGVDEGDASDQ